MKKKVLSAAKKKVAKKVAKKELAWEPRLSKRLVDLEKLSNKNNNTFVFVNTRGEEYTEGVLVNHNTNLPLVIKMFLDQVEEAAPGSTRLGMLLHLKGGELLEDVAKTASKKKKKK